MLRVRSTIEIDSINPYVPIDREQASELRKGWRRPMPVRFRVNGEPMSWWRVNLMPVGEGAFYLYLNGVVRKASSTRVGDLVRLDIEFDEEYRGGPLHGMPPWFAVGLRALPAAATGWARLSPSRRKEILRYFAGLKSTAAQERNLRRALQVLSGRRGRFMGRSWNETRDPRSVASKGPPRLRPPGTRR